MLEVSFSTRFKRDLKNLDKKHIDDAPLAEVINLIAEDTKKSTKTLKRRHNMHKLKGNLADSFECHVANYGDWLLVWRVLGKEAILLRTGTHDEIFK